MRLYTLVGWYIGQRLIDSNAFVLWSGKRELWKVVSMGKSWSWKEKQIGRLEASKENNQCHKFTDSSVYVQLYLEKHKLFVSSCGVQHRYISILTSEEANSELTWTLEKLAPLAEYHAELPSRSSCAHTVLQGNPQASTVNYTNSQGNYIGLLWPRKMNISLP